MSPEADFMILDLDNLSSYLEARPELSRRVGAIRQVEIPEDGNINRVFVIQGETGSLALKQGLPWVRIIETWELTAERTTREANFFDRWAPFAEGVLPEIFGFDRENHVIAMEDLSAFSILAEALGQADQGANVERIARLMARAFLGTSAFSLNPLEFSVRVSESENPEMAQLMEEVVFDQPWNTEPLDHCPPDLVGTVEEMLADRAFMARIGELKYLFRTSHESLIHGDLHAGSVMAEGDELRVFDAEFARYGPISWDLGEFIGHLRIVSVALSSSGSDEEASACEVLPSRFWDAFARQISAGWEEREDRTFSTGFLDTWLAEQKARTARFAGAEIARRMTGVGKAAVIENLPEETMLGASRCLLDEARHLIKTGAPTWS